MFFFLSDGFQLVSCLKSPTRAMGYMLWLVEVDKLKADGPGNSLQRAWSERAAALNSEAFCSIMCMSLSLSSDLPSELVDSSGKQSFSLWELEHFLSTKPNTGLIFQFLVFMCSVSVSYLQKVFALWYKSSPVSECWDQWAAGELKCRQWSFQCSWTL